MMNALSYRWYKGKALCYIGLVLFIVSCTQYQEQKIDLLKQFPSTIGTKEFPEARFKYEQQFITDPKTGSVPDDIINRERKYIRGLSLKQSKLSTFRQLSITFQSKGPANIGGRTRAIGVDVRNSNIILAGSATGALWRSEDGGNSWKIVSPSNTVQGVSTIVQDTRSGKEDTWYYGTGELPNSTAGVRFVAPFRGDGIFKSQDNGQTWQVLSATSASQPQQFNNPFSHVQKIIIDTSSITNDRLIVALYGGVMESLDGGLTWSIRYPEESRADQDASILINDSSSIYCDIELDNNGTLYLVKSQYVKEGYHDKSNTVFRMEEGRHWEIINPSTNQDTPSNRSVFAFNSEKTALYLFTEYAGNNHGLYCYSVLDSTWRNLSENLPDFQRSGVLNTQSSYNMMLKVHPENSNVVFLGATNLYRSDDGFTSQDRISWIGGYETDGSFDFYDGHHADQHNLIITSGTTALSATDGGVHSTDNVLADDVEWNTLNRGYVTSQFYTIAQNMNNSSPDIIGGMQDNGTAINDEPQTQDWVKLAGGDGAYCAIANNGNTRYVSFPFSVIFRSYFDGTKTVFTRVDPDVGLTRDAEFSFVNPFVLDPNDNAVMYLARGNALMVNKDLNQIPFRNTDQPANQHWSVIESTMIGAGDISCIEPSMYSIGEVLFGTFDGELFRVVNANTADAQTTMLSSSVFPDNGAISSISSYMKDEKENIMLTFSNYGVQSVFHSSDGGLSFTNVSGNLEEQPDGTGAGPSVRWIETASLDDGSQLHFAGTSSGLFFTDSLDGLTTQWVNVGEEEIGNAVVKMISYRSTDSRLLVATHGHGVFEAFIDHNLVYKPAQTNVQVQSIYPNPVTSGKYQKITLLAESDTKLRFRITDIAGGLVASKDDMVYAGTSMYHLKIPLGIEGVYIVIISSKGGTVYSGKILVK